GGRLTARDGQAIHRARGRDPPQARAAAYHGLLPRVAPQGGAAPRRVPGGQEISGGAARMTRPHQYAPPHWPAPLKWLCSLSHGLAIAEGVGIGACLVAVVFLATWQFVERNLTQHHIWFFHVPAWTDGVIRHSVFLLGFLGGAYATYT